MNIMLEYTRVKFNVVAKHGEIIHFRRFPINYTIDKVLDDVFKETNNITKIEVDKYYE